MNKTNRGARYIAIGILTGWEESRYPVDRVMEEHLAGKTLGDPRDRQLIMTLVYGVIRWRGYLDWVIQEFSSHPPAKIKPLAMQALRTGIFQLLFLDRVPASAAINETVQAIKDMKQPKWLTGFVNGVLRSVDRSRAKLPSPLVHDKTTSLPDTARLSHPDWLLSRWKKRYGYDTTVAMCKNNNIQAPLCLRANTVLTTRTSLLKKLEKAGLQVRAGKYSPLALIIDDLTGPVTAVPGYNEGLFQVQDEAAQLVSFLLGPLNDGMFYLDGCAGLGGKTSHLAQMLPAEGGLTAIEPNRDRRQKLQGNLERLRLAASVTIIDGALATLLPENREKFAGVLIDAPCSGLGIIRRHPDIRWNRSPEDLQHYREKQLGLLRDGARLTAVRGILVYATCSTEPEENDTVVERFLAEHPGFVLADCSEVLPENGGSLVDNGFFRTLPGRDDLDGFFGARLIKTQNHQQT
jgi:16S rRNA (cytosine967-C5)-methyltransferase